MSYLHSSAPRSISENGRTGIKVIDSSPVGGSTNTSTTKKKYRDPLIEQQQAETIYVQPNIMYDPRVLRGPTAGRTAILSATLKAEQSGDSTPTFSPASTLARTQNAPFGSNTPASASSTVSAARNRPSKQHLLQTGQIRPKHPSVAYIHNHITVVKKRVEVPMHLYLIEQKEETLVHDIDQQTDAMMEEPPTPDYVPRKTGVDTGTQVENEMVFEFDRDVEAILECVVSKGLEQALMEVREEEELAAIESHKRSLLSKYNSEEAEAAEKLRHERALFAAKEKLLHEARQRQQHIVQIRSKLSAGFFARHYLRDLTRHAIEDLRKAGLFNSVDSVSHQLEQTYMPNLISSVDLNLAQMSGSRTMVLDMLTASLKSDAERTQAILAQRAVEQAEREAKAAADRAAAEELERRRKKIQLFIHSTAVPEDQSPVGPINLTGESTIADIEAKVYRWMEENLSEDDLPRRKYLKFLWNGQELTRESDDSRRTIYDIGIQHLATVTMEYHPPTPSPEEEEEKGEDDEDEDGEEEEEEEEEEEDEDDV